MLAAAIALQAAAHLRRRPAAEIVLALDRAADVDLVGAALGHLAARARRLRQALVDGGPHRRPAQRGIGRLADARRARRAANRAAGAAGAARRRRAPASISWAWRAVGVCGEAVAAWSRRFCTSASALRLTSSSTFLRASSSASRFLCSSSAFLRASSSMARRAASWAARWRATSASRLASTRARVAGFLLLLGQRLQHGAAAGAGIAGRRTRAAWCRAPSWPAHRRPASGCGRSAPPAPRSRQQARCRSSGRRLQPPRAAA